MKKILSGLLCLVMCFSSVSVLAYKDYSDVSEEYVKITDLLYDLEIMEGFEDGNFKPDDTLTRAEATAIMVRLTGQEDDVWQEETNFSDVLKNHWASGYINRAHADGIVNGMGDGTFDPEGLVTYHQFVKMLVCLLFYEPAAEANGGWAGGGYLYMGDRLLITKRLITRDENAKSDAPITRLTAAEMVYNALEVEPFDKADFETGITGSGPCFPTSNDVENILTEYLDCEMIIGVVDSCDENTVEVTIEESKTYEKEEKVIFENAYRDTKILEGMRTTAYIRHCGDKTVFIFGVERKTI